MADPVNKDLKVPVDKSDSEETKQPLNFVFDRWKVSVPSFSNLYIKGEDEAVTVYRMEVSNEQVEWVLFKRFKEFLDLHKKLEKNYKGLPPFPPRCPKLLIDDEFLKTRQQALELYFVGLDDELFEESDDLREFLGLYGDRKLKPIADGVNLGYPPNLEELEQYIVPVFSNNSNMSFLPSCFEAIKSCLSILAKNKDHLDNLYGVAGRIEFVTSTASERYKCVLQLESASVKLDKILQNNVVVKPGSTLEELLSGTLEIIRKALKWAKTIDETVLKELSSHVSVADRVKDYQVQAEAKVMLLLSSPDKSQLQDIKSQLKQLRSRIATDLAVTSVNTANNAIATQMASILSYIDTAVGQLKGDKSPQEQVQQFETDVYQILERIGRLDDDASEKEFIELKQALSVLSKHIGDLRKKLETEQKTKGEGQGKTLINHLEDLQENLADLGYTYANKLDSHKKTLAERAVDAVGRKKTEDANNKRGQTESTLFEL